MLLLEEGMFPLAGATLKTTCRSEDSGKDFLDSSGSAEGCSRTENLVGRRICHLGSLCASPE